MNNLNAQLGDLHQLITADGLTLTLPEHEQVFNVWGNNYGAPPVEFITRRGYKQHGVTEVDYLIQPRTVGVNLYRAGACSRIQYWQYRDEIHNLLRHNRGGKLTLILRRADGEQRALKVRANPGAAFASNPSDQNSWNIDEPLSFDAFDPFWFDPVASDTQVQVAADTSLVFPITFPITFGLDGAQFSQAITYTGTWAAYPVMTLTGPYTSAEIENLATGVKIFMGQSVSNGDQRIIDLTPGEQSVRDAAGVNKFSDLAAGTNLVDFNIRPDPEVSDGIQTIRATLRGSPVYQGSSWKVYSERLGLGRWYRLSDSTASAVDAVGGATGSYLGGYTQGVAGALTPGDTDAAVTLNGSTGTISIPPIDLVAQSFTLQGFMKVASLAATPCLFSMTGGGGTAEIINFCVLPTGELACDFGGGATFISGAGVVGAGAYHLLTMTFNIISQRIRLYVDGVNVLSSPFLTGYLGLATGLSYLGSYGGSGQFVNGQIDEFQYIPRELSAAEIAQQYANRAAGNIIYTPAGFRLRYNRRFFAV